MMDNENREGLKPDIDFGSGAPAGTLTPDSRAAEAPVPSNKPAAPVQLGKPAAAPVPVQLGKPAGAVVTGTMHPQKPAGAAATGTMHPQKPAAAAATGTLPPQKPAGAAATGTLPPQKPAGAAATGTMPPQPGQTSQMNKPQPPRRKKKPAGAPDGRGDIGANFGSNTPRAGRSMTATFVPPAEDDKTRNFAARPHSGRPAADVDPADEDVTRHFGRTARRDNSARAERPARGGVSAEPIIEEAPERPAPQRRRPPRKKKKEHMFNTSIITGLTITIVVISASIVIATQGITLGMEYLGYNKSDKEVTFNIPEGADSEDIIDLLIENNIINNRKLFKVALRVGDTDILYPGDITLSPNNSYPEIIKKIGTQRELYKTVTLTFQEGTNLRAVAAKLEKNGVCKAQDFLWQFNKKLDLPLDSKVSHSSDVYLDMEGYFFPDTYEFYLGDSAYNVSKIVRENFDRKVTPEMYTRMNEIGMDLNQVITLASIVQWEAGNTEQMPIIASIFLNRLKDPQTFPNLQSDATKNYVTKVIDRVETSTAMLEHYTNVYDTYVCFGLPAGPVCSPGLDAINAVLYPANTDYYYFCNNLETGEAFYAETYEQHQKNLKKAGLKE